VAVFRIAHETSHLPRIARQAGDALGAGRQAPATSTGVRCSHTDGTRHEYQFDPVTREFTVRDERAIRHLDVDPRFTRIS